MKRNLILFFILFSLQLSLFNNYCKAQWTSTDGIYGGTVTALTRSGANLFAGTEMNGVYLSSNNGINWTQTSFINGKLSSLAVMEGNIFAGVSNNGLYVTTNNGMNWSKCLTQNTYSLTVRGTNIFAGTTNSGVYISTNNGLNWSSTGLQTEAINALTVADSNIIAGTNNGIYMSTNNGANWTNTLASTGLHITCMAVGENKVFAGGDGGPSIYVSTNNGLNWNSAGGISGLGMVVFSLSVFQGSAYAGTPIGIYVSSLNNFSWSFFAVYNKKIFSLLIDSTGRSAGTHAGLYNYNGTDWYQTGGWINNQTVMCLTKTGNKIFAGTDYNGVYLSSNNGANWSQRGMLSSKIQALTAIGDTVLAAIYNVYIDQPRGIYRSTNNGLTFQYTNANNYNAWSFLRKGDTVYAGNENGVLRSTNNGLLWNSAGLSGKNVRSFLNVGNYIFVGTFDDFGSTGVYRTSDNGANWTVVSSLNKTVRCMEKIGNNIIAGTMANGIFISTDYGINWTRSNNLETINSLAVSGNTIIAGTEHTGINISSNFGATWIQKNESLPSDPRIYALVVSDTGMIGGPNIIAGLYLHSVWKRPLSQIVGIQNISSEIPSEYSLKQNYPNPFNPVTKINFNIPLQSFVTLSVYDLLGREVKKIVNENLTPGSYSTDFDGADFASGMYFYTLRTNTFTDTKRMLLVK